MQYRIVVLVLAACGDAPVALDAAVADSSVDGELDAPRGIDAGFDVPLETWTWVDVPGMVCGNGSATGIAVNPSTRSSKVVLLFEGGGACWEAAACYGIVIPVTASHLDGFNMNTFALLPERSGCDRDRLAGDRDQVAGAIGMRSRSACRRSRSGIAGDRAIGMRSRSACRRSRSGLGVWPIGRPGIGRLRSAPANAVADRPRAGRENWQVAEV